MSSLGSPHPYKIIVRDYRCIASMFNTKDCRYMSHSALNAQKDIGILRRIISPYRYVTALPYCRLPIGLWSKWGACVIAYALLPSEGCQSLFFFCQSRLSSVNRTQVLAFQTCSSGCFRSILRLYSCMNGHETRQWCWKDEPSDIDGGNNE